MAFVAGEPMLWPALTGLECLEFLARLHGGADEGYRRMLVQRFAFDPAKKVRDYSKGNRQKIQLIAAFSARADLLVLDEPTSGLDPLMEAAFRDTVAEARAAGQTVFLSSHILSEVEALCDRVGILREGRLVEEGTLAELRHLSAHVVEATYAGAAAAIEPPDGVTVTAVGGKRCASMCAARSGRCSTGWPEPASSRSSAASRRSRRCSSPGTTAPPTMSRSPASSVTLHAIRGERVRAGVMTAIAALYALANVIGYRQAYRPRPRARSSRAHSPTTSPCACSTASRTTSRASAATSSSGRWA